MSPRTYCLGAPRTVVVIRRKIPQKSLTRLPTRWIDKVVICYRMHPQRSMPSERSLLIHLLAKGEGVDGDNWGESKEKAVQDPNRSDLDHRFE